MDLFDRKILTESCEENFISRDELIAILRKSIGLINSIAAIDWKSVYQLRRSIIKDIFTETGWAFQRSDNGVASQRHDWMNNPRYRTTLFFEELIRVLEDTRGTTEKETRISIRRCVVEYRRANRDIPCLSMLTEIRFWKLLDEVIFRENLQSKWTLNLAIKSLSGSVRGKLRDELKP